MNNRKFFVIILLMLCEIIVAVLCASANEIDAPKPKPAAEYHFNRKIFWTGTAILAAAKTTDAITTRRNLDQPWFFESNQSFGSKPSPGKQAGVNLAYFIAQAGAFYLTEHSRHRTIRWIGRAYIAGVVTNHVYLAECNASIVPYTGKSCRMF